MKKKRSNNSCPSTILASPQIEHKIIYKFVCVGLFVFKNQLVDNVQLHLIKCKTHSI